MSRAGTTTIVKIYPPEIEAQDKKVLCAALCHCDKTPQMGKDGQQLKQVCVAKTIKEVDAQLDHKSPYKQEINYDMTKSPPELILNKDARTGEPVLLTRAQMSEVIEKFKGYGKAARRGA